MPNFSQTQARLDSIHAATALLEQLRALLTQGRAAQASLELYTAGTDAVFNTAVEEIFTGPERAKVNQMFAQVDVLVTNWEANHLDLLEPGA